MPAVCLVSVSSYSKFASNVFAVPATRIGLSTGSPTVGDSTRIAGARSSTSARVNPLPGTRVSANSTPSTRGNCVSVWTIWATARRALGSSSSGRAWTSAIRADPFRIANAHFRDVGTILRGMDRGMRLLASGRISLDGLVTHRFELDRIDEAFETAVERPDGFVKATVIP